MKRLWAMADALPPEWIRGARLLPIDDRALGVCLCRQPLDVPTVMLPESGVLLSTYRDRAAHWAEDLRIVGRQRLDLAAGGDSTAFLEECLAARADAVPPDDARGLHLQTLTFIEEALGVLLRAEGTQGVCEALVTRSSNLYNERPVVRGEWLNLARQAAAITRLRGPAAATRWVRSRRKGLLTVGLLKLHHALAEGLAGDYQRALHTLWDAQNAIDPISVDDLELGGEGTFVDTWLSTRAELAHVFWRAVRLGDAASARRMHDTMHWTDRGYS
jgi:hypothetical protein